MTIGECTKSEILIVTLCHIQSFFDNCIKITKFFAKTTAKDLFVELFITSEKKICYELKEINSEKLVLFYEINDSNEKKNIFQMTIAEFKKFLKALQNALLSILDLNLEQKLVFEYILMEKEETLKEFRNNSVLLYLHIISFIKKHSIEQRAVNNCVNIFQYYHELFFIALKLKALE